jgi:hypothetical protein
MKRLAKFNHILDKNKVGNKDDYLNEDEKNMLQDMDYLKKQGYGDDFDAESQDET